MLTYTVFLFQSVVFFPYFGKYSLPNMMLNKCEETELIKFNYIKGNFQSLKGPVWFIFTYL